VCFFTFTGEISPKTKRKSNPKIQFQKLKNGYFGGVFSHQKRGGKKKKNKFKKEMKIARYIYKVFLLCSQKYTRMTKTLYSLAWF